MTRGKEVAKKIRGKRTGGIPWSVILDKSGKELVASDGPKGNIGCPIQGYEVDWFMKMLRTSKIRMTEADLATVEAELNRFADRIRPNRKRSGE